MTAPDQVTHPPVTHPDETPQSAPSTGAGKAAEKPSGGRSARRGVKSPPPKVFIAGCLVFAALELLLWQVAGVAWGIAVHLALAAVALVVVLAMGSALRRSRQRRRTERAGSDKNKPAASRSAKDRPSVWQRTRDRFRRAQDKSTNPSSKRPTKDRPSVWRRTRDRFRSDPQKAKPATKPSAKNKPSVWDRAKDRLRGGDKNKPTNPPAKDRPSAWRRFRRSQDNSNKAQPTAKRKTKTDKRPSAWAAFRAGLRGVRTDEGKDKPAPEAKEKARPAADAPPKKQDTPAKPTREQMVKEAVKKAADASPAPVIPPNTGGHSVGDMNKIRAAADEFAAALREYDPEDMHQMVREMPQLGEALNGISAGFKQMASRAESEWPVATPVAEGIRSIADDIKAGAGTAEETRGTVKKENETDIERGTAPRHGSINVERKWNV